MAANINVNSKAYWNNYVLTAQYDAGKYLGANANAPAVQQAQENGAINAMYRPIIISYTAPRWNFDFSSHVAPAAPARPLTQEERDQERADLAKVIGSIVSVIGAFAFALVYKEYATATETLSNTQEVNRQVAGWYNHGQEVNRDIYQLTHRQLEIDELNSSRISKYTLAVLGALAGGLLMAVGGFAVATALITAGQITLLAAAILAAGTLGWHWNDDQTIRRNYEAIAGRAGQHAQLGLADKILTTGLPAVDEHMNAQAYDRPPQYVPLYPELYQADAPPPPAYHPQEPSAPDLRVIG